MRKESGNVRSWLATLGALLLLSGFSLQARAQTPTPQSSPGPSQTPANRPNQIPDFADLNLTQDQIQRIRAINAELKDERQAARQRLQQAQRALTEAIESSNPDEALIEQRSREVAEAQGATIRLRALTEARILQVLTPEQREKLRKMQKEIQERKRAENEALRQKRRENNQRALGGGRPFPRGAKPGPKPLSNPGRRQQKTHR